MLPAVDLTTGLSAVADWKLEEVSVRSPVDVMLSLNILEVAIKVPETLMEFFISTLSKTSEDASPAALVIVPAKIEISDELLRVRVEPLSSDMLFFSDL